MQSNKLLFFGIVLFAMLIVGGMVLARFLLVNTNPILVSVLYSTEKEAWLNEVAAEFEGRVNGRPIQLEFEKMGSQEIFQSVVDGARQPDLISPASMLQISLLEDESAQKFGASVVNSAGCRSVVNTPLVLVAWQERAEALGWLENGDADLWERLQAAVVDDSGWSSYDHSEWGFVKFGHTNPTKSNSGLMTILLITYDYFDKTSGLAAQDILSGDYNDWFAQLGEYAAVGDSTGTFMQEIVAFGPSKYDLVAVYESTAIEQAENAAGRYGELRVYYPPATVLSDHPFCVLDADWVTPEEAQAAQLFVDYLLSSPVQEKALALGFRPAENSIALDGSNSPFNRYASMGLKLDLPPEVGVPPGDVLDTLIRFWERHSR